MTKLLKKFWKKDNMDNKVVTPERLPLHYNYKIVHYRSSWWMLYKMDKDGKWLDVMAPNRYMTGSSNYYFDKEEAVNAMYADDQHQVYVDEQARKEREHVIMETFYGPNNPVC